MRSLCLFLSDLHQVAAENVWPQESRHKTGDTAMKDTFRTRKQVEQMLFQGWFSKNSQHLVQINSVNQMHWIAKLYGCYLCRKLRSGLHTLLYVLYCGTVKAVNLSVWSCHSQRSVKDDSMSMYAHTKQNHKAGRRYLRFLTTHNFHLGLILFITPTAK